MLNYQILESSDLFVSIQRGSEVWGYQTYEVIEKVQIQFCKYVLGLSGTATGVAALGECGRFPVYNTCVSRCVKYWLHIVGMTNERYPKVMYSILKHLDDNGKTTWATHVRSVLYMHGWKCG